MTTSKSEKDAVRDGKGVIKNGRYFNTGRTYNADGTLRYDFDASNKRDPWFNGDTFHGYDDEGCPIWNKAKPPMTTPIEALELKPCPFCGGEAERVARIIDPQTFASIEYYAALSAPRDEAKAFEAYPELKESRDAALTKARAILATGLVAAHPDEVAIRADEREKCARVAERTPLNSYDAGECRADIAAAIRAGGV